MKARGFLRKSFSKRDMDLVNFCKCTCCYTHDASTVFKESDKFCNSTKGVVTTGLEGPYKGSYQGSLGIWA